MLFEYIRMGEQQRMNGFVTCRCGDYYYSIEYGTSSYNDYGEWNILGITKNSSLSYESEPLFDEKFVIEIDLDNDEINHLDLLCQIDDPQVDLGNESELMDTIFKEYFQTSFLTMGYTDDKKFVILSDSFDDNYKIESTLYNYQKALIVDNWKPSNKLSDKLGLYNIFVPILRAVISQYK